jgi:hypothetical protein
MCWLKTWMPWSVVVGGVFIAPTTKMVIGEGCYRWAHRTVRCASHVTQLLSTIGALTCGATGQSGGAPNSHCSLSSAPSGACSDFCARSPHCSLLMYTFAVNRWRCSRCSAGTPDSSVLHRIVRWIIAEWHFQKPKGGKFGVDLPSAPDSPVRQTRATFGCLLLLSFKPFLGLFIGLCWTFGTCRTYNLEQTS